MKDKAPDSWRTRAAVSEALDVFNSNYMQEVWNKAIARRQSDPDGAVTSARQLLESVCKHILTDAEQPFKDGTRLPELYNLAAKQLEIAPSEHTAPIFTLLFKACAEIVESIGRLRNHLSDAHGHGPFGSMPDWRHAELAVNLSAAMATYLSAVWAGRQPTVGELVEKFIEDADETHPLGGSHRFTLKSMIQAPIGKLIASKVQTEDILAHWHSRRAGGITAATAMHDVTYLRSALGGESEDAFYRAIQILREGNEVKKYVPRERRVTDEEIQAIISQLREPLKKVNIKTVQRMPEFVEFALWSGRTLDEICSLRWGDIDFESKTGRLPGSKQEFPLLEKACDVIAAFKPLSFKEDKTIFHDNGHTVSAIFGRARKTLRKRLGNDWGEGLTLKDLRYEAVHRLLEKKHPPHLVAEATGQGIEKISQIHRRLGSASPADSEGETDGAEASMRRRRRRTRARGASRAGG